MLASSFDQIAQAAPNAGSAVMPVDSFMGGAVWILLLVDKRRHASVTSTNGIHWRNPNSKADAPAFAGDIARRAGVIRIAWTPETVAP
jgi:hypothetical protein